MVLPPDLARLGDELTRAAARSLAARRHRRELLARGAATVVAGVLAIAALSPGALGPAQLAPRPVASVPPALVAGDVASGCDQGRGSRFGLPACGHTAPQATPARTILPRRPDVSRV
jgi:hypothetical protein